MAWRRRKALGRWGVRSAPTGHRIPARGEPPGMEHNRSVLKERRIPPGALTCFAVAGCQGWRWGLVPRQGSAGTVLRSQEGSGKDGAFALCARDFGDRLQCSLRPDPAAAWRIWGCSVVPVLRRKALGRWGVRSAPTGHRILARGETPGMEHNRSVLKERRIPSGAITCFAVAGCLGWRLGIRVSTGLRGNGPALAGNVGTGSAFALSRDQGVDVPMLAPARSRCRQCVRGLGGCAVSMLGGGQSACDLLVVGALDAVVGDGPIPVGHGLFLNRQIERRGVARILLELLALSPANHRPDLEPEVPGIVDGLPIVVSVIHPSGSTGVH